MKDQANGGLRKLFEDQLKDIFWAENALSKAMPTLRDRATSSELAEALSDHLQETQRQVGKLEEVFATLQLRPEGRKCEAMAGLIAESESILDSCDSDYTCDAGIIAAAQKIEHYEIATYGTLCAWAETLGEDRAADQLREILQEEKAADEILTELAESSINADAMAI